MPKTKAERRAETRRRLELDAVVGGVRPARYVGHGAEGLSFYGSAGVAAVRTDAGKPFDFQAWMDEAGRLALGGLAAGLNDEKSATAAYLANRAHFTPYVPPENSPRADADFDEELHPRGEDGRFTDGGGGAGKETASAVGDRLVTEMGTHPFGFSWRPDTGHATTGIMVAEHPNSGASKIIEFGHGGPTKKAELVAMVRAYVEVHLDQIMSDPEFYFGGWRETDPEEKGGNSRFYLDISRRYPNEQREAAIAAGAPDRNNQIAAWDIDNKMEIPTGGTGRPTR